MEGMQEWRKKHESE